jgi:zinc/manganese transport system ATP-binding protein
MEERPAVAIRGADCGYGGEPVLRDASVVLERGGFAGAVGPSGAGKTTLIRALTGRCRVRRGSVAVFGQPVRYGRPSRDVGYVPQIGTVDTSFPITVEQVTLQGYGDRLLPWPTREQRRGAATLLDRLGLADLAGRGIGELSGGELQRTFLARALVRRPRLLLLDEPTSGVDLRTRHQVLHLLADLNAEGVTVLLTTHDLNFVAAHLPRVICLAGRVVADGAPEQVLRPDVLYETYGAEVRVISDGEMVFVVDPTHLLNGDRTTPRRKAVQPWTG